MNAPTDLDGALELAMRCRASGDRAGSVRALRIATKLAPEAAEAWRALGVELCAMDSPLEALGALETALALAPASAECANDLGNALQTLARHDEALSAYERAANAAPELSAPQINMGDMRRLLDDEPGALRCYERALELDPEALNAHYQLACLLLARGGSAAALEHVDACLARTPYAPDALALRAVALAQLGRSDEVKALLDFKRLLHRRKLTPPRGFANIRKFNRAVEQYVLERSSLTADPFGASTRGGRHSDDIMSGASGPAAALKGMLQQAFAEYVGALPNAPMHPFIAAQPRQVQLVAQANILDSDGYLVNHVHPQAWVSGAYYVRVPREIDANDTQHRGWIQFGGLPDEIKAAAPVEPVRVRPEEGLLVLFPSYFYHGTVPFQGKKHRMSLGIDAIAVG